MKISVPLKKNETQIQCYHCGEDCVTEIKFDNKSFCCDGCKVVYELLSENNLCTYYSLNENPGVTFQSPKTGKYDYLDNDEIKRKLIRFSDGNQTHLTFYIPKIHCSSCIWLLENLYKLNKDVISSCVNFLKKEASIVYNDNNINLSEVVSLLAAIGYEPLISLQDLEEKVIRTWNKTPIIKIGVAGFCFGNIMMLSFPEYFSFGNFYDQQNLKSFFSLIILLLSLPVLFYSASEFFISAWQGFRQRFLNIDAPIAFAIIITFLRSLYEISTRSGPGYLDSMSGIIFFMLLGRYFQNITYDSMSFERDYKSYFPISVSVKRDGKETSVPVEKLEKGDFILIRNNELIPTDAILISECTYVDYSFVTGESKPVKILKDELVFAGGRQLQGIVEMKVAKEISQSYLTSLWNKDRSIKKEESRSYIHSISKYFTIVLFTISIGSFAFWLIQGDLTRGLNSLTTVLIVACPCALLLSSTFTNGNIIRILGRAKFYIKNSSVIEQLAKIDTIIFDKTGTITHGASINFYGKPLTGQEEALVISLAGNSSHPLSKKICEKFPKTKVYLVNGYEEISGQGIKGYVNANYVIMGSEYFVTGGKGNFVNNSSQVFIMINGDFKGYYNVDNAYRTGIFELVKELRSSYNLELLSGDNDSEKNKLSKIFGTDKLYFNQKPEDKSAHIASLQNAGHKVLMIGDGLNDTGALLHSDVGISVSDNTNSFSPSCDAILQGDAFIKLNSILSYIKKGKKIILASFILSILYNLIGLWFAVQGTLSPVIAAILMPVSSISIVLLTTVSSNLIGKRKLFFTEK
jgi:P-type Cu+ transporter